MPLETLPSCKSGSIQWLDLSVSGQEILLIEGRRHLPEEHRAAQLVTVSGEEGHPYRTLLEAIAQVP